MGTTWDNVLARRWWALGCFVRQKEPAPSAEASPNQPRSVWQFREPQAWAADGKPLYVGTRVQTQWTREEGGDDRWYAGSVSAVLASGEVTIKYDDGDSWTGRGVDVHLLDGAHPLKRTVGVADRVKGCLSCECLSSDCLSWCCVSFILILGSFVQPVLYVLMAFGDLRTGETGLWYTLDSCLSKTTPAFVYTLRAADAAGVHGGGFQPQAYSARPYPRPCSRPSPSPQ